jgi:hypothetical protein
VNTAGPDKPKLLVFHDSSYASLAKFMLPHFSSIWSVDLGSGTGSWNAGWVEQADPDIVMIQLVERYLDTLLPALLEN